MYENIAGKLSVDQTRSGGKLIDEWKFVSPFREKGAPQLSAKISIHKHHSGSITFEAHSESLPRPIVDSDINQLRQKVEAALRLQHEMLTGVMWESWLEVEVRGHTSKRGGRTSSTAESHLEIAYRLIKRGVHPVTGKAYIININGIAMPFPSAKNAGEQDPDVEPETPEERKKHLDLGIRGLGRGRDVEAEYSYLPATDENIQALDDLQARMQALRDALAKFLRQDTVQQSLSGLASQSPALPAPL